LLAEQGTPFTDELLQEWRSRGITQAVAAVDLDQPPIRRPGANTAVVDTSDVLRPYDIAAMQRLERSFKQASAAALEVAKLLAEDDLSNCGLITETTEQFLADIELDTAAVLSSMMGTCQIQPSDKDRAIAQRSAQLSVLTAIMCHSLKHSSSDCMTGSLAAMLHDISLYESTANVVATIYGTHADEEQRYLDHPLQSASMLAFINGVSEGTKHIITQVHEEMDGGGFPRGLMAHRLHPVSKIIHVADAYLTLTAIQQPPPLPPGAQLLPADAIAYLLHHTVKGRFDTSAVRALVASTSAYPIGSAVELDDSRTALVHRTTDSPTQPIVRIDSGTIIDLRNSGLSIKGPISMGNSVGRRIPHSELGKILWRTELV
jgi:HD-GYP domain-containing protein (c-di-GMP phosphodiesterase class II)